jgi:hypothetical protein
VSVCCLVAAVVYELGLLFYFRPLRPSACQSVRMDFLAVCPGVHAVDALTLTDIESGFCMNLRSVVLLFLLLLDRRTDEFLLLFFFSFKKFCN